MSGTSHPLQSFIDEGRIVAVDSAGWSGWRGGEMHQVLKITVRQIDDPVERENGLRRDIQNALGHTFFHFVDEAGRRLDGGRS